MILHLKNKLTSWVSCYFGICFDWCDHTGLPLKIHISLASFRYFLCSILYLKSVGTLLLSLFCLAAWLFIWLEQLLAICALHGIASSPEFYIFLALFSYKILHANYLSLLECAFLKSIGFALLFHYCSFWTAPFMVRLPKFTPLLTGIKLNQGLLNFCTLSIYFYITW